MTCNDLKLQQDSMEEWLKVTQGSDSFTPILCIPRVYICQLVNNNECTGGLDGYCS